MSAGEGLREALAEAINDDLTPSLTSWLADTAHEPLPSSPNYASVNPEWLRLLIAEARAVRALLADTAPVADGWDYKVDPGDCHPRRDGETWTVCCGTWEDAATWRPERPVIGPRTPIPGYNPDADPPWVSAQAANDYVYGRLPWQRDATPNPRFPASPGTTEEPA